jgi:hypothetical protein
MKKKMKLLMLCLLAVAIVAAGAMIAKAGGAWEYVGWWIAYSAIFLALPQRRIRCGNFRKG